MGEDPSALQFGLGGPVRYLGGSYRTILLLYTLIERRIRQKSESQALRHRVPKDPSRYSLQTSSLKPFLPPSTFV